MSFSWWIHGKNGEDLLAKYGISRNMVGFGYPDWCAEGECPFTLQNMRIHWVGLQFTDKFEGAAQDAVHAIQAMALRNLKSLKPHGCPDCKCEHVTPDGWSADAIQRLLLININEVWRAGGGW